MRSLWAKQSRWVRKEPLSVRWAPELPHSTKKCPLKKTVPWGCTLQSQDQGERGVAFLPVSMRASMSMVCWYQSVYLILAFKDIICGYQRVCQQLDQWLWGKEEANLANKSLIWQLHSSSVSYLVGLSLPVKTGYYATIYSQWQIITISWTLLFHSLQWYPPGCDCLANAPW